MNNASASIFSLLMGTIARKKMEFNKNLSNRTFFKNLEKQIHNSKPIAPFFNKALLVVVFSVSFWPENTDFLPLGEINKP